MNEIATFPYITIEFDKSGQLRHRDDLPRVRAFVTQSNITDLFVVSHGWNNDNAEAQSLYEKLFGSVQSVLKSGSIDGLTGRGFGVLGIFWPSREFKDTDLGVGGGAASAAAGDESDQEVNNLLDELNEILEAPGASAVIGEVKSLTSKLDNDPEARRMFADKIRSLLPRDGITEDDGSDRFFSVSAEKLFSSLEAPIRFRRLAARSGGGAAGGVGAVDVTRGGAAGFGDLFRGVRAAARRILNYSTYYVMKARAGSVGATGVREVVSKIRQAKQDLKIHLVGHSFGGRVVTAACMVLGDDPLSRPTSMTLLQAAFSHNGFAKDFDASRDGHFRSVAEQQMVSGPILVTHTHNDWANATAYPIASRIAGQDAATLVGGPRDRFGAIGANGAQHTPEADTATLLDEHANEYSFLAGRLYNLNADKYIKNHGDVHGKQVANAILHAVAST